jgi:hypothetical protein
MPGCIVSVPISHISIELKYRFTRSRTQIVWGSRIVGEFFQNCA